MKKKLVSGDRDVWGGNNIIVECFATEKASGCGLREVECVVKDNSLFTSFCVSQIEYQQ